MTREMTVPRDRWEEDDEVVVTAWMYDDGARVKAGTVVVEVMVSKTQYELEAPADGVLHIVAQMDDIVQKGSVLARIEDG